MFAASANALLWGLITIVIVRYLLNIHGARDFALPLIAAVIGAVTGWRQARK